MVDNYSLFRKHEDSLQAELDKLPECYYCGEKIQDEYLYDINDNLFCYRCIEENFKRETENYTM